MAGFVITSAAVGSLLLLVTAVPECQCACTDVFQVIPSSYEILSAAVYEDQACNPSSSSMRGTLNSPVTCFPRQATGATPRLTDGVLGPDNLTSPTTDYAYTLAGSSAFGLLENWIEFYFTSRVSLASVTLHYYSTGQSPQLQLSDGSAVVIPPVRPPCDCTAQRQCLTFSVCTNTAVVTLEVLRNGNTIYISEVKFFEESDTPSTDNTDCCISNTATPRTNQLAPTSTEGIVSVTPTPTPTPDDNPCGQVQPCQNSGTCVHTGAGQYQCVCSEEYEGENCTLAGTDECNPNPCQNGGECIDLIQDFRCVCHDKAGKNCDLNVCPSLGGVVGGVAGVLIAVLVAIILVLAAVLLRKHLKERVDLSAGVTVWDGGREKGGSAVELQQRSGSGGHRDGGLVSSAPNDAYAAFGGGVGTSKPGPSTKSTGEENETEYEVIQ